MAAVEGGVRARANMRMGGGEKGPNRFSWPPTAMPIRGLRDLNMPAFVSSVKAGTQIPRFLGS